MKTKQNKKNPKKMNFIYLKNNLALSNHKILLKLKNLNIMIQINQKNHNMKIKKKSYYRMDVNIKDNG